MRQDVVDLHAFYHTLLGQTVRRLIRRRLKLMWPDLRGMRLLGIGYATPFLRPYLDGADRVIALMPAGQGCVRWPADDRNRVLLAEEATLPLPDSSMDRILLAHAVEQSDQLRRLLREVWRVLAPNGRVIVMVPNRRSPWSWAESTPFGHGHPYTIGQLETLLRENMFLPTQYAKALFLPPTHRRVVLRWAPGWENLGARWLRAFGGVTLFEAGKQLYAGSGTPARRRIYLPAPHAVRRAAERSAVLGPR